MSSPQNAADVFYARVAVKTPLLQEAITGDGINIIGNINSPTINSAVTIQSTQSSDSTNFITSDVSGDTDNRLSINANGDHSWSNGSTSADLRIYRSSSNNLSIDNGTSGGSASLLINQIIGNSSSLTLSGLGTNDHVYISQNCAGLTFGNTASGYIADSLNYCENTSLGNVFGSNPGTAVSTFYVYRIGRAVHMSWNSYIQNLNNTSISFSSAIPTRFAPGAIKSFVVWGRNNAQDQTVLMIVDTSGNITLYNNLGGSFAAASGGFYYGSISWMYGY